MPVRRERELRTEWWTGKKMGKREETFHRADRTIAFADFDVTGCEDGELDGLAMAVAVVDDWIAHFMKH